MRSADLILFTRLSYMIFGPAIQTISNFTKRALEICVIILLMFQKSELTISCRAPGHLASS